MYYSATNPALTPVEGVATWTVTHNLGTENVNCSLYNGDNLVISNVAITSENVITVRFNASTNIPAETYKIVVISNGAGSSSGGGSYVLPTASTTTLGGVRIDGSTIKINNGVISSTVDSTLSETSTNPVQNKVINTALDNKQAISNLVTSISSTSTDVQYPSAKLLYDRLENKLDTTNFLPDNYTINLKADGTGDYPDLQSAINSLEGKFCNGRVNIELEAGTYNISSQVNLNLEKFNFSLLYIGGNTYSDTILKATTNVTADFIKVSMRGGCSVFFKNLTFEGHSNLTYGLVVTAGAFVYTQNVRANTFKWAGFHSTNSSKLIPRGNMFVDNCNSGFLADASNIDFDSSSTSVAMTNIPANGFFVRGGGIIRGKYITTSYTNVTHETSQAMGTFTSDGYISVVN